MATSLAHNQMAAGSTPAPAIAHFPSLVRRADAAMRRVSATCFEIVELGGLEDRTTVYLDMLECDIASAIGELQRMQSVVRAVEPKASIGKTLDVSS